MMRKLEKQYTYLLSCINLAGYNLPKNQNDMTKKEIISALQDIAKKELQTEILTQKAIENWLRGLPSSIGLDFSFMDIENRLKDFRIKPTDKNVNNWFNVCAFHLLQMFDSLNNKTSWFFDK